MPTKKSSKTSRPASTKHPTKRSASLASERSFRSDNKPLPRLSRSSLPDADFNERTYNSSSDRVSTLWIVVFAFAILAVISVVVWALLSGRSDGKIHGENLEKIRSTSQESTSSEDKSAFAESSDN